jgi:predicted transcriptional regulator YheO
MKKSALPSEGHFSVLFYPFLEVSQLSRDEAFNFLDRLAQGIAEMFGVSCETVIHDFSVSSHPILSIYNGHISDREVGSTLDLTGLEQQVDFEGDVINLLATTPRGQQVKSSTFSLKGPDYHLALGVNYDFTPLAYANRALLDLMRTDVDFRSAVYQNRDTKISDLFQQCADRIGKPIREMNKADRLRIVELLSQQDAFSYRRAVPYVAAQLGVSRYTIYKYLDEVTVVSKEKEAQNGSGED